MVGKFEYGEDYNSAPDIDVSNNAILNGSSNDRLLLYANNVITEPVYFLNNLFSGNSTGYYLEIGSVWGWSNINLAYHQNYMINNDGFYLKAPTNDHSVENNWWGTTTESEIQDLIYDWNDDASLGFLDYDPWLTTPNTSAPISPPKNVVKQVSDNGILITWNANPESDVAGY